MTAMHLINFTMIIICSSHLELPENYVKYFENCVTILTYDTLNCVFQCDIKIRSPSVHTETLMYMHLCNSLCIAIVRSMGGLSGRVTDFSNINQISFLFDKIIGPLKDTDFIFDFLRQVLYEK